MLFWVIVMLQSNVLTTWDEILELWDLIFGNAKKYDHPRDQSEVAEMDCLYFEIDDYKPLINTSNKYKPVRGVTYYVRGEWDNPKRFTRQQTSQATRRWRRMGRYDGLCDFDVFECKARSLIGWDERYYW
jgi:hypothetical protein